MSDELKPCPLCNSPIKKSLTTHLVSCSSPFCPLYKCQMKYQQWQFRPLEDALHTEIKKIQHGFELQKSATKDLFNQRNTLQAKLEASQVREKVAREALRILTGEAIQSGWINEISRNALAAMDQIVTNEK